MLSLGVEKIKYNCFARRSVALYVSFSYGVKELSSTSTSPSNGGLLTILRGLFSDCGETG